MKYVYLASRFMRQAALREIRGLLASENKHIKVVSSWIDAERPTDPDENFFNSIEASHGLQRDLDDVESCDILVADMTAGMGRRAGMLIEIGYARGLDKEIVLVGDRASFGIFGHIFNRSFPNWHAAIVEYFRFIQ